MALDISPVDHISPVQFPISLPDMHVAPKVEERRTELKNDNDALQEFIVDKTVLEFLNCGYELGDLPPEFHYHVGQVKTVALALVRESNVEDTHKLEEETVTQALSHDIGRIKDTKYTATKDPEIRKNYSGDTHTGAGAAMLEELGFSRENIGFATAHHRCGLGTGGTSLLPIAQEQGVRRAVEVFDLRFGLVGLATLLADMSKEYPHNDQPQLSEIAEITAEKFDALRERQLKNGFYAEGKERDKAELVGKEYILEVKAYLKEKYGIDYEKAIVRAKHDWVGEKAQIEHRWKRAVGKIMGVIPQIHRYGDSMSSSEQSTDFLAADDK